MKSSTFELGLSLLLRQLIDLLATDKSRYFAQPRSIIVKYVLLVRVLVIYLLDSTIHLINHYPLDNLIASASTYRVDCDLSAFCLAKASVLKKQYSWQIPRCMQHGTCAVSTSISFVTTTAVRPFRDATLGVWVTVICFRHSN